MNKMGDKQRSIMIILQGIVSVPEVFDMKDTRRGAPGWLSPWSSELPNAGL